MRLAPLAPLAALALAACGADGPPTAPVPPAAGAVAEDRALAPTTTPGVTVGGDARAGVVFTE